jgi:hypothetical protein
MATPNSRQSLIDFCLRRLGAPVIEINVDDDQIEDKVDDALQMYQEFHSDATYRTYLKHVITQSDKDNGYIPIDSNIIYVSQLFPLNTTFSSVNMFDIRYQMMLNSLGDFMNFAGGMSYYYQMQQYLEFLDQVLSGYPQTTWSRHQDRLYVWGEWSNGDLDVGDYVVAEVYTAVDPDTFSSVYNDMFMKNYTTALIKQQWGMNMSKFEGMQLPGGVTISGRQILEDANTELKELEEKLRLEQELPPDFFVG